MTSIRHLIDILSEEDVIDPTKVQVDNSNDIDPSKVTGITPPAETPQHPAHKQWAKGVLGMGSQGPEVKALQKSLGITDDGQFGQETRNAVIAKQKELGVKADGAWGPITQAAFAKAPKPEVNKDEKVDKKPDVTPEADPEAEARKRIDQYKQDQQTVADADFKKQFGNLGRDQQIRQTGNMKKPWTELKDGDVDYDDRGVKQVYRKGAEGGPGNWQAVWGGDSKSGDWSAEPGLGLVGPSANSPEGQAYLAARKARIMNPQQAADYDRLYPQQQPANADQAAPVGATGAIAPNMNQVNKESVGYDEVQRLVNLVHYK